MTHIVLVGGGHAHLEVLKQAERFRAVGCQLTLIDPGSFYYSGMASGFLAGSYRVDQLRIDLAWLASRHQVDYLPTRVIDIDRPAKQLRLASGESRSYDLVSLNIGSELDWPTPALPVGDQPSVFALKPIEQFTKVRAVVEQWHRSKPLRIVVVGAGISGSELAANSLALSQKQKIAATVTLLSNSDELASQLPAKARERLASSLAGRGVDLRFNQQVLDIGSSAVEVRPGRQVRKGHQVGRGRVENGHQSDSVPADLVILAAGLRPPSLVSRLQLPVSERGLRVDEHLRSADDAIFAVGDCADIGDHQLPKVGVYGVRAATTLIDNLLAAASGETMGRYHPQQRFLSILNLGDGTGLAWRGNRWFHGRTAMWLKDRIDRRFVARYHEIQ